MRKSQKWHYGMGWGKGPEEKEGCHHEGITNGLTNPRRCWNVWPLRWRKEWEYIYPALTYGVWCTRVVHKGCGKCFRTQLSVTHITVSINLIGGKHIDLSRRIRKGYNSDNNDMKDDNDNNDNVMIVITILMTIITIMMMIIIIIIVIIMKKNFNRRSSHGHHCSKRRELAQHAHSRWSHAFTHHTYLNTVTTTLRKAPAQQLQNLESIFYFEGTWGSGTKPEYPEKNPDSMPANRYHNPGWELNPHPPTLVISSLGQERTPRLTYWAIPPL